MFETCIVFHTISVYFYILQRAKKPAQWMVLNYLAPSNHIIRKIVAFAVILQNTKNKKFKKLFIVEFFVYTNNSGIIMVSIYFNMKWNYKAYGGTMGSRGCTTLLLLFVYMILSYRKITITFGVYYICN